MHVQRAIETDNPPALMICTDVSDHRLEDLTITFGADAAQRGIEFVALNPSKPEDAARLAEYRAAKFDDIIVLAPVGKLIADSATSLAPNGTMNVFAGVARGTMVDLDLSAVYLDGARWIGHSGSLIQDLRYTLEQAESGKLSPHRAVAAIGSLSAARDGLKAVQDTTFPGKVVIFPHIKEMPLTSLPELKDKMPTVYAKLKDGREWTLEAEEEFLRLMLP
jgi:threonine dehydrogenase-like Zn-dependent dehydrogenase